LLSTPPSTTHSKMRAHFLTLLPLIAAFQLPIYPDSPPAVAEQLQYGLGPSDRAASASAAGFSFASDMRLESVPDEHVVITSALHPNHKMRIKAHHGWCDPDVKSYSGYLDVGYGKDLFFYFFESRSKPKEDPVMMWINGGCGDFSCLHSHYVRCIAGCRLAGDEWWLVEVEVERASG